MAALNSLLQQQKPQWLRGRLKAQLLWTMKDFFRPPLTSPENVGGRMAKNDNIFVPLNFIHNERIFGIVTLAVVSSCPFLD